MSLRPGLAAAVVVVVVHLAAVAAVMKKSELNDELNSAIIFLFVYYWPVLTNAFILSAYGSGYVSSYLMV